MNSLPDECLVIIFKKLDLRSRLAVAKTCKLWRQLVTDPTILLENVSEVYFDKWSAEQEELEVTSVLAVFAHFKNCRQLKLDPSVAHRFLLEQRLKVETDRFKEVVLMQNRDVNTNLVVTCLQLLPSKVKNLRVEDWSPAGFCLKFPDSDHQEDLEMIIEDGGVKTRSFVPPRTYRITNADESDEEEDDDVRFIEPVIEAQDVPIFATRVPGAGSLALFRSIRVNPLISELNLTGLLFTDDTFSAFLRTIRDGAPNLRRISFQNVGFFKFNHHFDIMFNEFSAEQEKLQLQWIKMAGSDLDGTEKWNEAIQLLLCVATVETLVINFRDVFPFIPMFDEVVDEYLDGLDLLIKEKGIKLELILNSVLNRRHRNDICVSSKLKDVLVKLEVVDGDDVLKILIGNDSFDLLTEVRLENCIGLSDATLEIVAKWCGNLKKLFCQPRDQNAALTNQCLSPFMNYWDDRKSAQLSIECLKPAEAFGGFNLPMDQEKGDFPDGKKWMMFRTACQLDGSDQFGTRLIIRELEAGKSMVITDYKRQFDTNVKISVIEGKCIVKEI